MVWTMRCPPLRLAALGGQPAPHSRQVSNSARPSRQTRSMLPTVHTRDNLGTRTLRLCSCSAPPAPNFRCSTRAAMPMVHSPWRIGRSNPRDCATPGSMCSCVGRRAQSFGKGSRFRRHEQSSGAGNTCWCGTLEFGAVGAAAASSWCWFRHAACLLSRAQHCPRSDLILNE